jgi:hypothetical protein
MVAQQQDASNDLPSGSALAINPDSFREPEPFLLYLRSLALEYARLGKNRNDVFAGLLRHEWRAPRLGITKEAFAECAAAAIRAAYPDETSPAEVNGAHRQTPQPEASERPAPARAPAKPAPAPADPRPNNPPPKSQDVNLGEHVSTPLNVNQDIQDTQIPRTTQDESRINHRNTTGGRAAPFGRGKRPFTKAPFTGNPHHDRKAQTFNDDLANYRPSTLSFADYAHHAMDAQNVEWRNLASWQSRIFYFIRLVKAHPEMGGVKAKAALRRVEDVLIKTMQRRLTKEWECRCGWCACFYEVHRDDAHAEFLDTWDKIRYLPGKGPLDNAIEHAARKPITLHAELAEKRPEGYSTFISIAGWLQVTMGERNILLPVEPLADLLQVEPMTISRYRKWAREDGFLREVVQAQFRGKGQPGRATEFRFDVARVPILQEQAQGGTAERFRGH